MTIILSRRRDPAVITATRILLPSMGLLRVRAIKRKG
jgi:hypothetical protein